MAYVEANGTGVVDAKIYLPRQGVWHADLTINSNDADDFAEGAAVEITAGLGDDKALAWSGTVHRGGLSRDTRFVKIVGGAAGLPTEISPKAYRDAPVRQIVSDILGTAKETLSPTSDNGILATQLPRYTCQRQTAGEAIAGLLLAIGADVVWRVLPDGTIWIGRESWPTSTIEDVTDLLDEPQLGRLTISADVPDVRPGQSYAGRHVSYVEHDFTADALRTRLWLEDASTEAAADRVKQGVISSVRAVFPRIDYLAVYPSRVAAMNADGTVDLKPDDTRLSDHQAIPIRLGLPGVTVRVAVGARVGLGFAGGDPTLPEAHLWESATLQEITITADTKAVVVCSDVRLGTSSPTQYAARADRVESQLSTLKAAINGAVVAPGDGGAAFKTAIMTALAAWPGSTAANKVKVD